MSREKSARPRAICPECKRGVLLVKQKGQEERVIGTHRMVRGTGPHCPSGKGGDIDNVRRAS